MRLEPPCQDIPLVTCVRRSASLVTELAEHIHIDSAALPAYAASLPQSSDAFPFDTLHHYHADIESTVLYVLCLSSINFGSGYFPYLQKRRRDNGEIMAGYYTIASYLRDSFETRLWSYRSLQELDVAQVAAIFKQDIVGSDVASRQRHTLMRLFQHALCELGIWLQTHSPGGVLEVLARAEGSADWFMKQLITMPFFQDVSMYRGHAIALYKRAQITVSDLAFALPHVAETQFKDIDTLTIFADNLVPHVLHCDGILRYSPALQAQLTQGKYLPSGSAMEVELRALAVEAVEQLRQHHPCSARQLDVILWNCGQAELYRQQRRHRSCSVFY